MKPGDFVKWQIGTSSPAIVGKVAYVNGATAQVIANGATYEIAKAALRVLPICKREGCNKPLSRQRNKYCCQECSAIARTKNYCADCGRQLHNAWTRCKTCHVAWVRQGTDDAVFAAIVKYQRKNAGATPPMRYLSVESYTSEAMIKCSIRRLEAAGKIRLINKNTNNRHIIVVGARWVYEEEAT